MFKKGWNVVKGWMVGAAVMVGVAVGGATMLPSPAMATATYTVDFTAVQADAVAAITALITFALVIAGGKLIYNLVKGAR